MEPSIEALTSYVGLRGKVAIPQHFLARFPTDPAVVLEVEVVDKRPLVRSVSVTSTGSGLKSDDLRMRLTSELLPAAVRASVRTVIGGEPQETAGRRLSAEEIRGKAGLIGPITLLARVENEANEYDKASRVGEKRGRPRHITPTEDLAAIAALYGQPGRLNDIMINFNLGKSTARRRIAEARAAGLLEPEGGEDGLGG